MLMFVLGISEAVRFRPIEDRSVASMDSWDDTQLTEQQTELIRNWARTSHVFVGRGNGTDPGASVADARQAAALPLAMKIAQPGVRGHLSRRS
ncbi:hypothetical protein A7X85_05120 [Streptomyces sp. ST1015]|nr:hypothetical protein A7X85_05120 [Streptomyces sp. ST1015]